MLNLHRMRLLVELSRRGTLAQVAQALSFSTSTISQQLSQLETEAGVRLIEPVGRGVGLTAAGHILVEHAERILQQIDRAEAALAATRSEIVGVVKVATFQTAAISLIPDLLRILGERHPGLTVYLSEIQPDAGAAALLAREFDLVLGEEYPGHELPPPAGIESRPLLSDVLRLYVGSQLRPHATKASLSDFADLPWVLEPKGKPARAWAESACRAAGFEPDVRYESADLLVQARLAETDHAVAVLPDLVWKTRRAEAQLVDLPGLPVRQVYTAVRTGAETRPVLAEIRNVLVTISRPQGVG
ncbi:LysR substrate-binding domain-containing protein [Mycolicibacterium smegmatis]|uniref:LysR substrate-binding domain-containing protein n=1 Tax=Mycolicibacterium smegmatis TaxID=1772 RepID=UPI0005D7A91F|nr:LysR substrate-binding domain-containing protein [Mycolicibacterium smegmatis]MDF1900781.1 LysR substrate-binding domain-containing protein [Mycolicibacterium smegmatis]MDF1907060.1 LysR substrate-binding domain-containing protein [Mycolicibacterium smegmatis]MDF1919255.1 LysR substrate-binding domain-containing protein [Mycolicibacterium smegmatis]MDF1925322.1 LysR substrate-binding domain-containing protein [Mycolicibacterium smegmatis]UAK52891.1 LysR family transcriptional regulator [Myc